MARTNIRPVPRHDAVTHGGVPAYGEQTLTPLQQLRRSVMSCMLWEDEFYEDGEDIAQRIARLVAQTTPEEASAVAIKAREDGNLRHAPLWVTAAMAKHHKGAIVGDTVARVVQRADELAEMVSLVAKLNGVPPNKVKPVLSAQVKRGLARAFQKFDAYSLAKYNRDGAVKLRDVLFLVHAKPLTEAQAAVWAKLIDGTLASPDTWEVNLSAGADKRETFERLLREDKLGYMALLRNLRNMVEAGVDRELVRTALLEPARASRVLPFRYIAAARHAPSFASELDWALRRSVLAQYTLPGKTAILVDVSGSMEHQLSGKSDMTRMDAAAALAACAPCEDRRVFTFSDRMVEVANWQGLPGVDAIVRSQPHSSTNLAEAVAKVNGMGFDRLIVITDEQATFVGAGDRWGYGGAVPDPVAPKAYVVNVASNKNGIGYKRWVHLDGFSESILRWISEYERG